MNREIFAWKYTSPRRSDYTFRAFITTLSGQVVRTDVRKAVSWLCREYRITSVSFFDFGDCLTVYKPRMRRLLIFLFNHCCSYRTVPTQWVVQTKKQKKSKKERIQAIWKTTPGFINTDNAWLIRERALWEGHNYRVRYRQLRKNTRTSSTINHRLHQHGCTYCIQHNHNYTVNITHPSPCSHVAYKL